MEAPIVSPNPRHPDAGRCPVSGSWLPGFDDQAALARQPSIRRGRYRSFFSLPVSRKELAFS